MNLDITYCSKINCKNLKCERNQEHLNKILIGNHPISISENTDCKYWEE